MSQLRNVRVVRRNIVAGAAVSGLIALLAQGGCAVSDPGTFILLPDSGTNGGAATGGSSNSSTGGSVGSGGASASGGSFGSGGDFGTGGVSGFGGFNGTGGATGGTTGTGGFSNTGGFTGSGGSTGSGGFSNTGGFTGSGGFTSSGGATGAGGTRATGGSTGSGGTGAGGAGGSAATFTQIYQMILSVSCTGNSCHNPGTQGNVSFASQSSAYSAVKSRVTAGNATGSSFYKLVNGGGMPPGGRLSSSQLALIASWINAGAMNN